jgi:hypothetical protein
VFPLLAQGLLRIEAADFPHVLNIAAYAMEQMGVETTVNYRIAEVAGISCLGLSYAAEGAIGIIEAQSFPRK